MAHVTSGSVKPCSKLATESTLERFMIGLIHDFKCRALRQMSRINHTCEGTKFHQESKMMIEPCFFSDSTSRAVWRWKKVGEWDGGQKNGCRENMMACVLCEPFFFLPKQVKKIKKHPLIFPLALPKAGMQDCYSVPKGQLIWRARLLPHSQGWRSVPTPPPFPFLCLLVWAHVRFPEEERDIL